VSLKIIINAIGKITERELITLSQEYIKRSRWDITINEFAQAQEGNPATNKAKEAFSIWPNDLNNAYVIVLDEKGKEFTSVEFSGLISKLEAEGVRKLYFLIGGADGHDTKTLKNANIILSLGKMTLPHKLARLILIEQIYRAFTINSGHPYHR
jgi:23S rRNA (pseudouridine1915-N3)-methyltransferase